MEFRQNIFKRSGKKWRPTPISFEIKNQTELNNFIKKQPDLGEYLAVKGIKDAAGLSFKKINAHDTALLTEWIRKLIEENDGALVQEFIHEIKNRGELSIVYFEDYSYTFFRIGPEGEERVQILYGGKSFHFTKDSFNNVKDNIKKTFKPSFDITEKELTLALNEVNQIRTKFLATLDEKGLKHPCFYRIDGIVTQSEKKPFLITEIEMIDCFWEFFAANKANNQRAILPLDAFINTIAKYYPPN